MASLFLVLLHVILAFANTEVVKYTISDSLPPLPFSSPDPYWPVLSHSHPSLRSGITPATSASACSTVNDCQHQLWAVLNMTDSKWSRHHSYILYASWPATFPTVFTINVYSSSDNPNLRYARVYAIVDGVFTPPNDGTHPFLPHRTASILERWNPVPFYLNLEPEYLGFLPESMIPVAVSIIVISLLTYMFVVPPIDHYLQDMVEQARKELVSNGMKHD
ncbi:hypothetical protein APHAL10511_005859 [Amanita phalloides]|nr:hypothetical protein APHAL10511_005859 [Amanita phalloides]